MRPWGLSLFTHRDHLHEESKILQAQRTTSQEVLVHNKIAPWTTSGEASQGHITYYFLLPVLTPIIIGTPPDTIRNKHNWGHVTLWNSYVSRIGPSLSIRALTAFLCHTTSRIFSTLRTTITDVELGSLWREILWNAINQIDGSIQKLKWKPETRHQTQLSRTSLSIITEMLTHTSLYCLSKTSSMLPLSLRREQASISEYTKEFD